MKATTIKTKESSGKMEGLLNSRNIKPIPKVGDLVTGQVISVGKNEVLLDIDGYTIGIIRGAEFYDESGEYSNLKIGDEAAATVVDLENEKGQIELSFRYAGHQKAWDKLKELLRGGEEVEVDIIDANKGGLMIRLGRIAGFLPVSQLAPQHYPRVESGNKNLILEKLKKLVGKKIKAKIIATCEDEEKLIVSEKETLKNQQTKKISKYGVGDVVEGKISGIVDFGVFVEFDDNLEGLVHISELAWQRIDNPRDLVKVGQKVKAEIIDIDDSKISLSMKKLLNDPWKNVQEKYKIGQTAEGEILKINPFGLFVKLDDEIHGLAHVSELGISPGQKPEDLAKLGDKLKFKIVSLEPEDHRLGLSLRAIKEDNKSKKDGCLKNQTDTAPKLPAPEDPDGPASKDKPVEIEVEIGQKKVGKLKE